MPKDWYLAALEEARAQKLRVVGHVPIEISPAVAADAGHYMIEHTETLFEGTFSANLSDEQLPAAIRAWLASDAPEALFATLVRDGTWVDPTLSGYLEMADLYDPAITPGPLYRYVAASQRKIWAEQLKANPLSQAEVTRLHEHMNLLVDVTARMHKAGVRIVAGTDAAAFRLVGFSLHHELVDLVRAGLTPLQALQAATLNPAIAFGKIADLGTIEPGKLADLVLLNANPLESIDSTQSIAAVVSAGRLFQRSDLTGLLQEAERLAAAN
jgi:imidazolonepropionase-like amidohydrolase